VLKKICDHPALVSKSAAEMVVRSAARQQRHKEQQQQVAGGRAGGKGQGQGGGRRRNSLDDFIAADDEEGGEGEPEPVDEESVGGLLVPSCACLPRHACTRWRPHAWLLAAGWSYCWPEDLGICLLSQMRKKRTDCRRCRWPQLC
jgi:hypothetical protein